LISFPPLYSTDTSCRTATVRSADQMNGSAYSLYSLRIALYIRLFSSFVLISRQRSCRHLADLSSSVRIKTVLYFITSIISDLTSSLFFFHLIILLLFLFFFISSFIYEI